MHSILSLLPYFDVQLFAEGADGGTGAGETGAGSAAPAQPQQGVKNPLASIKYGKQETEAPAAGEQQQTDEAADRSAQFEALIKGEYKDLYDRRVQDTIQRRLRANEETVNRYNQLSPVLQMLGEKYGVDANDAAALSKAIEEDDSFYEEEALESGMSVQQIKAARKMKRENAELRAQIEQQESKRRADEIYAEWDRQGQELKKIYPSFDLRAEMENEDFRNLLRSRVPLRTAFEVIHKDEIIPAAMQYTAKQVEQKLSRNIAAGQSRPAEGAMGSQGAVQTKSDVSQLTKADRDEIDRRVARGERIMF